jgi:hypothetical protein
MITYDLPPPRRSAIRWLVHTGQINPMGLDWRRFVVR